MKGSEAASPYANPIIFLFMGGFMVAMALEKHKLHERIALNLIRITGTSGNGIILGFMISTGFISMWISNTATAIMMLPIAISVINLLKKDKSTSLDALPKAERNFAIALLLMIGYGASLGGLGTIIGTPPNVVFKGLLEKFYNEQIDFAKWMMVGVPVAITLLFSTYFLLTRMLFPNRLDKIEGSDKLIAEKLKHLGALRKEERLVLIIFCIASFLWIFQQAINYYIFQRDILNDTNIAMLCGMLMFLTPYDLANKKFILEWTDTKDMQWGILILFGGGLCLAEGLENAGLIQLLGEKIAAQSTFGIGLIFILIVASVFLTEFMSNVALVQIFIPVIFGIAQNLDANPILLAMPATFGASIAFMFPISTPPNAIVFSSGYIRMKDMVKAGLLLNLVSIGILLLASTTLMQWVFG